jgi:serine/threonine-protein kinase
VVGQDITAALTALAGEGLQPKIRRIFSDSQPDTVTAQQPHAGDSVIKGTVVHINVSRGAKPVPIPDVTGQPFANAKSMLEGQGFQVGRTEIQSDLAQGVVVAETPAAGTSVPRGTKITLSVSKGPATTQVPDVTGMTQSTAESLLTGAGLTPSVVYDPVTDPAQDGIVQSTDPAPGSDAKSGDVVIIHVGQLQSPPNGGTTTTTPTP